MKKLILSMFLAILLGIMPCFAATVGNGITTVVTSSGTLTLDQVSTVEGEPGDTVTVELTVNNGATVNIDVAFTSTDLECSGCDSTIDAPTITDLDGVNASSSESHSFTVTIPTTEAGSYEATLTATDKANADNNHSVQYEITVNSLESMSASPTAANIYLESGETGSYKVTLTNTGSETLSSFEAAYEGDDEDEDGDIITVTAELPTSLAPGESAEATIEVDTESGLDTGTYSGIVTIDSGDASVDVDVEIEVLPKMCDEGVIGDLSVRIKDPDNGENIEAGERLDIEVGVDNDYKKSMYVIVEAYLYDADEDDVVESVKSESEKISSNDDENFELELVVPYSDMDDDHTYYLYAIAHKKGDEDEHCNFDRVELELEPLEEMVVITDFRITPTTANPGDTVTASVTVENLGEDEQESVYVLITDSEFGWEEESDNFDLEEYGDSDDEHKVTFRLAVPEDAEAKTYYAHATVFYEDGERSESFALAIEESVEDSAEEAESGDASLEISVESPIILSKGQTKFTIPVMLTNRGGKEAKVSMDVTEYSSWADVIGIESPEVIYPNENYHVYVYMTLKEGAEEGTHNLRVNIRDGTHFIDSSMVSVQTEAEESEEASEKSGITGWAVAKLENRNLFWVIADVVLVLVALLFLRALFRK